jgi:hypothetical protein
MPPRPRSGRSRWVPCRVPSFTAGRPKTFNWPFERRAIAVCRCRCGGGGHHWAGFALCAGIVIDVGGMNGVSVNAGHRSAIISGGARAADVSAVTDPLHVAAVTGTCSGVGMAGLTFGGGYGRRGGSPDR